VENKLVDDGDLNGVILETMVRQLKMGLASSVGDRDSTYRRCLGWTTTLGKKLGTKSEVGTAFNDQWHKFIQTALRYYKDKRLAEAIQLTGGGGASAATKVSIQKTLELLKESFKTFGYGRCYYNTLNAIVYAIASMDLIRNVRSEIGIPKSYEALSEYISAAYYSLIEGKAAFDAKPNRYLTHIDCAEKGRDLLLDIQELNTASSTDVGEWIDNSIVEERVESYRKAYRDLTNIDLLTDIENIDQKV
jgi:hypothetical protein